MTPKDLLSAQQSIESAPTLQRDTNHQTVLGQKPLTAQEECYFENFGNTPKIKVQIVDTCQIMQIYLQRPQKLATLPFCLWFAGAHKLQDKDFNHCASQMDAKLQIVEKGYNRLPLEPLHQFNKSAERN